VSYGNQPGLQVAHLFNYVGYPWLTQYWVRQVKERTYGSIATDDGYGHHDEDQGQMASMSALMAIGLFEVTGGGLTRSARGWRSERPAPSAAEDTDFRLLPAFALARVGPAAT
jgi:Glycosyl hydrolase family 92 catalytic domain